MSRKTRLLNGFTTYFKHTSVPDLANCIVQTTVRLSIHVTGTDSHQSTAWERRNWSMHVWFWNRQHLCDALQEIQLVIKTSVSYGARLVQYKPNVKLVCWQWKSRPFSKIFTNAVDKSAYLGDVLISDHFSFEPSTSLQSFKNKFNSKVQNKAAFHFLIMSWLLN